MQVIKVGIVQKTEVATRPLGLSPCTRVYESQAALMAVAEFALAFAGGLGSFRGKVGNMSSVSGHLFNIAADCWRRVLLEHAELNAVERITVFVHAWSTPHDSAVRSALRPAAAIFEAQPLILPPNGSLCPVEAHHAFSSQWRSRMAVLRLVRVFELTRRLTFTAVLVTRFDACPCQATPIVPRLDLSLRDGALVHVGVMKFVTSFAPSFVRTASGRPDWAQHMAPRVDDGMLLGRASALLSLARAFARGLAKLSRLLGKCDVHAILALALLRTFPKKQEMQIVRPQQEFFHMNRVMVRYELQGCNHPVFAANASRCFTLFCKDRRLTPARPGTDIARGGFELQLSCTQLREAWVRLNLTRAELEHWGGMSRRAGRGVSARSRRSVANESTWEAALRGCR